MKRNIIYYPCATLGEDINESMVSFRIDPFPGNNTILLKASITKEPVTKNGKEYVVWIRIGNEMMKVIQWNPTTNIVRVERNFDGIGLSIHKKGDISSLPAYKGAPGISNMSGNPSGISYHIAPVSTARWDKIYSILKQFVNEGGDGVWIDILSDGCYGATDIAGKDLPMRMVNGKPSLNSFWNFETDTFFIRDDYRKYNEKGVSYIQENFRKDFGRNAIIYGNNLQSSKFEPGIGGCKFYLVYRRFYGGIRRK